jgi:predicted RNase H-like nuclease (RuvC/YqgF family)
MENKCPHCGADLQESHGNIIYLRAYKCGSYGSLANVDEFTQSVSCMQAQIKKLKHENKELRSDNGQWQRKYMSLKIDLSIAQRKANWATHEEELCQRNQVIKELEYKLHQTEDQSLQIASLKAKIKVLEGIITKWKNKAVYLLGRLHESRVS